MRTGVLVTAAVFALALSGCGTDDDAVTGTPESDATELDETVTPADPTPAPEETVPDEETRGPTPEPEPTPKPEPTKPERTPGERITPAPTEAPPPATGEVPEQFMNDVLADAADRASVSTGDLTVIRAQAVQWPDGSLGCPEPGQMYTQALVDGYWVELEAAGKVYDYRLNDQGMFRWCTSPTLTPPGHDTR